MVTILFDEQVNFGEEDRTGYASEGHRCEKAKPREGMGVGDKGRKAPGRSVTCFCRDVSEGEARAPCMPAPLCD